MVEDVRKVLQDFLAPELRSIATRMDGIEKQRAEDKSDLLHAFAQMEKQRAADKADMLCGFESLEKQRVEDGVVMLRAFEGMEKQRVEDKSDMLRGFAHMEKRFEMVVDYTKVLERVDKLEEAQQPKRN